jgi:hypothetical protein
VHGLGHLERAAGLADELDLDHGIGAVGHRTARRDRHRLARLERAFGREPGRDPERDREPPRRLGRAQRVAVHRGAGERRQVDRGDRGRGEEATGGGRDRHALRLERRGASQDPRERLLDREQRRHRRHTLAP